MRMLAHILAYVLSFALLGAAILNFAEFNAAGLKPRVAEAFSNLDPDLHVETDQMFVAVKIFQGRITARLSQARLHHPSLEGEGLAIDSLDVDLPLHRLLQRNFRPSKVQAKGIRLRLNIPNAAGDALPSFPLEPPEQAARDAARDAIERALEKMFADGFVPDLGRILPTTLPTHMTLRDVSVQVLDPTGLRPFFMVLVDSASLETDPQSSKVRLNGNLRPPQGQDTPFAISASLNQGVGARMAMRIGALIPAQFYDGLRFLNLQTPERLRDPYRFNAAIQLSAQGGAQTGQLELTQILQAEQGQDNIERTLAYLEAEADPKTDLLTLEGSLAGVRSTRIAPWTPVPEFIEGMNLILDGHVFFYWHTSSNDWELDFEVERGSGTVAIPPIGLPSQPGGLIGARQVATKGRFTPQGAVLDQIHIETGSTEQAGPILNAEFSALSGQEGTEIAVRLTSANVSRGDLFYLWPSAVAPKTRTQVASYIEAAGFRDLIFAGIYRLQPSKTEGGQPVFIRDYEEVRADFDQATVRITPDLPTFQQAAGRLDLVNDGLDIRLDGANFGPGIMRDGFTKINFGDPDWLTIHVGGQMQGPISPSLATLADSRIGLEGLRTLPLADMQGQAAGSLDLTLAFNPKTVGTTGILRENIGINTSLTISDLQVRDYLMGDGIRSGTLDLIITDQGLTGQGRLNLDGMAGDVDIAQVFSDQPTLAITARVDSIPAPKVQQFIPGLESFLIGTAQGRFDYLARGNERASLAVDMDLSGIGIDFPALVYQKSTGQAGRIQMNLVFDGDRAVAVEDIDLTGPELSTTGDLTLNQNGWEQINLASARVNGTDLQRAQIQNLPDRLRAVVQGGVLDLRPFLDQFTDRASEAGQGPRSNNALGLSLNKPVFITETRLDRLVFEPDAWLKDVGLALIIADDGLRGMSLNATTPSLGGGGEGGGGRVTARVQGQDGDYRLNATADDFGGFMQSLGISEDIRNGDLVIEGNSANPLGGGPWNLSADATDFQLLDTPALVQVTSAISLTGILEQLGGTGLAISRLEFRGTLAAPAMHIQRLKLDGPSLGLSMAGALNWQQRVVSIRGTLSIFNLLNMAVRDIPILRELLTGADGQGLVATQFKISGSFDQAEVQVDPLSTIQPGLLRSIIDEIEGEDY